MPMQKPSRLLPDDSHHLMATDCVLPQVALWGKGMVCALKRTSGLNGWISNQKHISLQSVALREGSRGFEDCYDPITRYRILLTVLLASSRQKQHDGKCGEINDNESLVHILFLFLIIRTLIPQHYNLTLFISS